MRRVILLVLLAGVPAVAAAQSSQFGVRGLGLPVTHVEAREHTAAEA